MRDLLTLRGVDAAVERLRRLRQELFEDTATRDVVQNQLDDKWHAEEEARRKKKWRRAQEKHLQARERHWQAQERRRQVMTKAAWWYGRRKKRVVISALKALVARRRAHIERLALSAGLSKLYANALLSKTERAARRADEERLRRRSLARALASLRALPQRPKQRRQTVPKWLAEYGTIHGPKRASIAAAKLCALKYFVTGTRQIMCAWKQAAQQFVVEGAVNYSGRVALQRWRRKVRRRRDRGMVASAANAKHKRALIARWRHFASVSSAAKDLRAVAAAHIASKCLAHWKVMARRFARSRLLVDRAMAHLTRRAVWTWCNFLLSARSRAEHRAEEQRRADTTRALRLWRSQSKGLSRIIVALAVETRLRRTIRFWAIETSRIRRTCQFADRQRLARCHVLIARWRNAISSNRRLRLVADAGRAWLQFAKLVRALARSAAHRASKKAAARLAAASDAHRFFASLASLVACRQHLRRLEGVSRAARHSFAARRTIRIWRTAVIVDACIAKALGFRNRRLAKRASLLLPVAFHALATDARASWAKRTATILAAATRARRLKRAVLSAWRGLVTNPQPRSPPSSYRTIYFTGNGA